MIFTYVKKNFTYVIKIFRYVKRIVISTIKSKLTRPKWNKGRRDQTTCHTDGHH